MFSSDQNIRSLRALIAEIKSYIGLRYELARLDLVSKFTVLLAAFFLILVLLLLLLFALFFLSYSTAKGLADTLGNESLALLLVAGFYLLLAALLPCLATGTPQDATTNAEVVDMLKEPDLSPPVPTISRASEWSPGSLSPWARISVAEAAISSTVSPFTVRAVRYEEISVGEHSPLMMRSITSLASSKVRSSLFDSLSRASVTTVTSSPP